MDELEKQFYRAMNLPHIANGQLSELAKAAASLCREREKELLEVLENLLNDSCYEGLGGGWFMWSKDNSEISLACKRAQLVIAKYKK